MKNIKLLVFTFICLFMSSFVFANDDIVVKEIKPIYDANSGIVVNDKGVVFNDKNQNIKYKITLKNNSNKDYTIDSIGLTGINEDFLIYDVEGIETQDVLVSNKERELIISLGTIKTDGWGRNFNDELIVNLNFDKGVVNPNTDSTGLIFVLISMFILTGLIVVFVSNKKINRYMILLLSFGTIMTVVSAKDGVVLPIKINVVFESQNVMKPSYIMNNDDEVYVDYWEHSEKIKNIIIDNDNKAINEYDYKFDVSNSGNEKVLAYLVKNRDNQNFYDLYLVSDGLIYMNKDASYYFYNMKNLDSITNLEKMSSSLVTNMHQMFSFTSYNNDEFDIDLSYLDTSNVTDMSYMFNKTCYNCSTFELDINSFDTSKVENMSGMFTAAGYSANDFHLSLEEINTSKVTDMSYMFNNTGYKSTDFVLDIKNFDFSKVKNLYRTFYNTGYSSTEFDILIDEFNLGSVENMKQAFYYMGYNSNKLNLRVLITSPNVSSYDSAFTGVANNSGSSLIVNYTNDTEELVDKILATKPSTSNVLKGKMLVETDTLDVGDVVKIDNEYFNVFDIDGDNLLLLAKYNIGNDYRQSSTSNYVKFSKSSGWEYTPGPKEVDIQTWTVEPKKYVNGYLTYISDILNDNNVSSDLVSLTQLKKLGCKTTDDYQYLSDLTCVHSPHHSWLINGQEWWTKSANYEYNYMIFTFDDDGTIDNMNAKYISLGVRPLIKVSKNTLNEYLKA